MRKDGKRVLVDIRGSVIEYDGKVWQGIFRDITQRKQMERELRASEEKYRIVVEKGSEGIIVFQDGVLKFINPKMLEFTGYSKEELTSMPFMEIVQKEDQRMVMEQYCRWLKGEEPPNIFHFRFIDKKGNVRWAEGNVISVPWEEKPATMIFLSDITKRKWAEEALRWSEGEARRLAQENAIMAEIGRIISSTLNIEEVYTQFAEEVRKVLPFDRVSINIVDFEKNIVTAPYVTGISVPGRQPGDIFPLAGSLTEEAIRTRKGLILHPQDENEIADRFPGFLPIFRAGFRSMIMVPLISKDQAIGGLHFSSTKPNIYNNIDLRLAQSIGSQIAGAIANAQLFRERMRAEKDLRSSREQLRALAVRLQSVREEERTQIAREIHDDLGQTLTALKMDLFWLKKRLPKDQKLHLEKIKSMSKLIDMTVKAVKRISTELRPGLLDDLGLSAAIEWQAQDFQNRTGVKCEFNSSMEDVELDRDRSTAVFRIFQETLTNVARHANATRVKIALRKDDGNLILEVQDNGRGIRERDILNAKSLGLLGMKERAHIFGGEVNIRGVHGKGTTVTVSIPLVEKQKAESGTQ